MSLNKEWCLVTGATSGVGKEFANYFGKKSYSLILTGRREKELKILKEELESSYMIEVLLIIGEFCDDETINKLLFVAKNRNIKYLVNNVGYGNEKTFFKQNIEESLKMIKVHIDSTIKICHELIPLMQEESYVLNVSPLAGMLPTSYNHIYAATKSFLITFSESLSLSLIERKIKVKVIIPGFVKSDFHRYTKIKKRHSFFWMDSARLVELTFKELKKENVLLVPGRLNKIVYFLIKVIPKKVLYYFLKREKEL